MGNISWSTGSTDFTDTISPPVGTNTYSVTVDYGGGCVATDDVTIIVDTPITPTFTQVAPICINTSAPTLPTTSDNGVTGTWSPSTINTSTSGTSTYTFTPDAGLCATTTTMDITIDPAIQSTFAQLGAYCVGDTPDVLLGTSIEGITGTWSPAVISTASSGTSTYTFTVDAGQCALGTTMDVDITAPTTPTFTQVAPICINTSAPTLPTTSDNGVTGTWSPSTINTSTSGTSTYTFTPDAGLCATTTTMDITIDPAIQSTFAQLGAYCVGDTPDVLLGTSIEGITGTWSPAVISTASSGTSTYTFTVDAGQCALGTTMDVDITAPTTPTFTQLGPYCVTGNVDALPLVSNEGFTGTWSPDPINNSSEGTFTTIFTPTPGQCAANETMEITINPAPFIEAAATDSLICEGDSIVLYISDISAGMLVDTFTMTFGSAFSYTTNNTSLPGPYVAVVNGTYVGATGEIRDAHYLFQQGGAPITPIAGSPWQWNGTNVSLQSVLPWSYNPSHEYNFFFNGGGPQTFSFTDSNYGDNSGSLTFEIYYLGNISWSTGSTDFTDTISPPVGTNTYSVTVDYGGGCVATDDVTIIVDTPITPTFTQVAPICINTSAPTLPTTSDNGVTGTWSPSTINTSTSGTSTYTFTPDAGLCATTTTMDITIDPAIQSTFAQLGAYCVGDTPDVLLGTSIEGITGTWSPAVISTASSGTSTYTFTIDAGQCALGTTMDVDITAPTTPTFTQVPPICINTSAPTLPTTSDNGVTGTWSPSTINTSTSGTSTYTFTPDAGLCATTTTMDITIDPAIQSTFAQLGAYCVGDTPDVLLGTSIEGITGTWSPAVISTASSGTSTYTFTVDAGQCALGTTMDVDITAPTTPTFTQVAPICINTSAPTLPTTSDNGVTGTWSPSTINTSTSGTSTYTFTPDAGLCATTTTMDITIDPAIQSTFAQLGAYCVGDTPDVLLGTSIEGITGTWSPAVISTASSGTSTYTFTIDAGQCALGTTMDVDITAPTTPTFTQVAPICINTSAPTLPTTSDNGVTGTWSPSTINTSTAGTSTYTFTPDAGLCATTTTMDIEIISLPTVDAGVDQEINCVINVNGAQIGSAPVAGNIYNWTPSTGLSDDNVANPIANPIGSTTYTLTVTNPFGCSSVGQVNVTIDNTPPIIGITNNTGSSTLTCTLLDISLTATGGVNYSWDNGLGTASTVSITSPGTYTVTGFGPNGCSSTDQITITENTDIDLIVALSSNEICSGEDAVINVTSTAASSFNWTVTQTGVSGATAGSGSNSAQGLDIIQTLTATGSVPGTVDYIINPVLGSCTGTAQTITITVNPPLNPLFSQLGPYCLNEVISDNLNNISDNSISGTWSPATISTSTIGTTTYTFTPQAGECAVQETMNITVNDLPSVSINADNIEGCAPLLVNLTGGSSTGTNIWTIENGDVLNGTSINTTFLFPGCYDVSLYVEENGCSNTLTLADYICIQNDPIAAFTVSPQSFTDVNQIINFSNNSQGAVQYIWDFGDGLSSQSYEPSHLFVETEAGALVTLTAISDFGCLDSTQVFIPFDEQEIFYVPNTFTPDGDNFNQVFTPVFYSGFDPYNFEMLIFNRWGELIFETRNADKGWDGSYGLSGGDAQDGVYTWKITYKNPETDERKIVVGHVTLLR